MSYFDDADKRRTKELQKSIKQTIALLGWSLKDFVSKFMIETHDSVEEEDINQFYETMRKQLDRDSTSQQLLVKYHTFLFSTDEYKHLRKISDTSSEPNNFPLMKISEIPYESPSNSPKIEDFEVLSMAISYAKAMGSCWDFTLIKNDLVTEDPDLEFEEPLYIVIYQCDFGFGGGSGCRGVGIIEIKAKHSGFGGFFIADKKCEIDCGGARFSHVVGMKEGELIIMVRDFDSLDHQVGQTLFAKVILSKNLDSSNEWKVKSKEYIHKDLATDLCKLESGYT